MNAEERLEPALRRLSHWSLIITIAIGALSLIGWISGLTILKSIKPYYIPIAPSTASCLFILSIAFLIYIFIPSTLLRTITAFCASLTILIASMLFISFFMGIIIEAEHLGFIQIPFQTMYHTGHMSPVTAIMFIVASSGILLLCLPTREKQLYKNAASFMGMSVSGAGLTIIVGYLYGTPLLYGGTSIPVAFQTALAFVFLGLGIILTLDSYAQPIRLFAGSSIRSLLMRKFLPALVGVVLLLGVIDAIALSSAVNLPLTLSLIAIASTVVVGIIITKIAKSVGWEIDQANRERDEKVIALQKSEEQHLTILLTAMDGICRVDRRGHLLEVNDAYCRMIGYSMQEILTMRISDFLTTETAADTTAHIQKILEQGDDRFEIKHRRKDGSIFDVEVSVQYRPTQGGQFVAFLHDITERKLAEEKLQDTLENLRKAIGATIQVMVSAVETRDPYTSGHQIRTADLAHSIATEMGLPEEKIEAIRMASSIHDIGKLSIPAEILSKPTKLSEIEFSLIKEHTKKGYELLKDVESPWPLADIVYQHHERMDGSGYPRNLKGEDIIIEARIIAVADVVEAMASHRPYRPSLGIDAALNEIEKNRGILYDSEVADACLRLFRENEYQFQ